MSRTAVRIGVGFIVKSPDHLPGSLDADDVTDEVRSVLQAALDKWFESRGRDLLSGEAMVA